MTVYSPSSFKFAMGIGAAGAMVEVTDYVRPTDGATTASRGRTDQFKDIGPGLFSFTLDNRDGRFTPGNLGSPLVTKVAKNMAVSWELNGVVRSGRIRSTQVIFPSMREETARLRVTVEDDLGQLARQDMRTLTESMILGATAYAYWPFDDAAGSASSREASGYGGEAREFDAGVLPTFDVEGVPAVGRGQIELSAEAGQSKYWDMSSRGRNILTTGLPPALGVSGGFMGLWVTPLNLSSYFEVRWDVYWGASTFIGIKNELFTFSSSFSGITLTAPFNVGQSYYLSFGGSNAYINGVSLGSIGNLGIAQAQTPRLVIGDSAYGISAVRVAQLSHTAERVLAEYATETTEANRLLAIDQASTGTVQTPSGYLSDRIIGPQTSGSLLDALNEIVTTEQGQVYTTTTGTLTAPVQSIVIRDRARPVTPTLTIPITDIIGAPDFIEGLTNAASSVQVSGPTARVNVASSGTYTQAQLAALVGSANASETVLNQTATNLTAWGEDRINRGITETINIVTIRIDARSTTSGNRWADLLAARPGDRHSITGLPSTQLGYSTWDGWLLGVVETHAESTSVFELSYQPVLDAPARFDIDRFMDDGELYRTSSTTAIQTTIAIGSTDTAAALMTTTAGDFPFTIKIDNEEMTVTACTSATPQVATVVRGVNGTTAATHAINALVTLGADSSIADPVFNRFLNPKFSGPGAPQTSASMTASLSSYLGNPAARGVAISSAAGAMPLQPDVDRWAIGPNTMVYCTLTVYNTAAGSRAFQPSVRYYDAAGTQVGLDSAPSQVIAGGGGSATFTWSGLSDAGTVSAGLTSARLAGSGAAAADEHFCDNAFMSDTDWVFFSGDSINSGDLAYSWAGTAQASQSVLTFGGIDTPSAFAF